MERSCYHVACESRFRLENIAKLPNLLCEKKNGKWKLFYILNFDDQCHCFCEWLVKFCFLILSRQSRQAQMKFVVQLKMRVWISMYKRPIEFMWEVNSERSEYYVNSSTLLWMLWCCNRIRLQYKLFTVSTIRYIREKQKRANIRNLSLNVRHGTAWHDTTRYTIHQSNASRSLALSYVYRLYYV